MIEISRLPERKRKLVMALLSLFRRAPLKSVSRIVFSEVHRKIGKSLRFMISGGAKLSVEVAKGLEAFGFTVLEGYGLTETSPLVSVNTPENRRIGSVGLPIDGVEVKVENGEILVKGDNVMRGYYNKPEETEKVIKDGWFYTGDLGYVKEGFIYVTGRAKEVIVLENGKNVYPEDIENEILRSKYILEVGVFEEKGVIKSIVRPNFDLLIEKNVKDIVHFVKKEVNEMTKHLQPYKRVREIVITDRELPRTRIGKLRRFLLPELYKELKSVKKTSNISTV
jgi:long-chain acyl-CoA synthetase